MNDHLKTKSFAGEYDWPEEEALAELENIKGMKEDGYTAKELDEQTKKIIAHWTKVFGDDEQGKADLARFIEVFKVFEGIYQDCL
jgi:hypothetical protein